MTRTHLRRDYEALLASSCLHHKHTQEEFMHYSTKLAQAMCKPEFVLLLQLRNLMWITDSFTKNQIGWVRKFFLIAMQATSPGVDVNEQQSEQLQEGSIEGVDC